MYRFHSLSLSDLSLYLKSFNLERTHTCITHFLYRNLNRVEMMFIMEMKVISIQEYNIMHTVKPTR